MSSPQLPTPRRALFSSNILAAQGGHGTSLSRLDWSWAEADRPIIATISTPPVPSSSPGISDSMDMDLSPLPHKAPYGTLELQLQSPTPDLTSASVTTTTATSLLTIPSPSSSDAPTELSPILKLPHERRKSLPRRLSLSKAKSCIANSLPPRPVPESQLPPFKFGNYSSQPAASPTLSLSEIFADSPVPEKQASRLGGNPVMNFSKSRPASNGFGSTCRNMSPTVAQHMRKSSNPLVRPRKQFRRSLSMFEHPEDIMKQEKEAMNPPPLPSIMDIETSQAPQLPHFFSNEQVGDLPRIQAKTMIEILDGRYNHKYEKFVIIDCRFEYEYLGGHINGAVNFNDKDQLAAQLFDVEPTSNALLIFHCEYSAHRAPIMAKFIRNKDRAVNADRYPHLTYPEAYILDGGYSSFFKDYRDRCYPQNYVEMDAEEHAFACERGLGKVKQRSKLVRAQTFAFGDRSPSIDSSPTTMVRSRYDGDMDFDMTTLDYTPVPGLRPAPDCFRGRNPRMFSY